ncbi:MAG: hypothetical protein NTV44_02455, partial [Firmicutes bacterium]|nr:hypothetical protein [Bacillota bacterium]
MKGKLMDYYDSEKEISGLINYRVCLVMISTLFNGELKCTAKKYSGIKTIALLRVKENQRFEVEINVTAGKAKLVAIKNREIILLGENHFAGPIATQLSKGLCR